MSELEYSWDAEEDMIIARMTREGKLNPFKLATIEKSEWEEYLKPRNRLWRPSSM